MSIIVNHDTQKIEEGGGCGARLRRLSLPFTIVRRQVIFDDDGDDGDDDDDVDDDVDLLKIERKRIQVARLSAKKRTVHRHHINHSFDQTRCIICIDIISEDQKYKVLFTKSKFSENIYFLRTLSACCVGQEMYDYPVPVEQYRWYVMPLV